VIRIALKRYYESKELVSELEALKKVNEEHLTPFKNLMLKNSLYVVHF
jgi:hypothetical protein